jgi:acylphosphatase
MRRVHVLIYGTVQGVFFRRDISLLAENLHVKGFVMNVNDGVEAVFEGTDDSVEKMLEFCRKGPSGAVVSKVDVKQEKYKAEFPNFEVR